LCFKFEHIVPDKFKIDGNKDFTTSFVPSYLSTDMKILDVGGGKSPYLSLKEKQKHQAYVIGLDIDQDELELAPEGVYDEIICCDIAKFDGSLNADLIICRCVLEHTKNVGEAIRVLQNNMAQDGILLLFVPSKKAWFAKINRVLPESIKQKILYTIFPETESDQGFPAFYNLCTISELTTVANENSMQIIEKRCFYISSYFTFFFPLYLVWRLWILLLYKFNSENAAETFSLAIENNVKESCTSDSVLAKDS